MAVDRGGGILYPAGLMPGFFQRLFVHPNPDPGSESEDSGGSAAAASPPTVMPPSTVARAAKPFTVAELANLLPPEWVKLEGVDVSREVAMGLETLGKTTASGRPAVLLTEVYRACPEIFRRPVTEADDFEVRLTPGRARVFPGTESVGKAVLEGAATPFRPVADEPVRKLFPSVVGPKTTKVTLPPPKAEAKAQVSRGSPFELVEPPPGKPMEDAAPIPARAPSAPSARPAPQPNPGIEVEADKPGPLFRTAPADVPKVPTVVRISSIPADTAVPDEVQLDLAEILKGVPVEVLGFPASELPSGLNCRVARAKVRTGIFSGTGLVSLKDVVAALPASDQARFGKAKGEHELVVPLLDGGGPGLPTSLPPLTKADTPKHITSTVRVPVIIPPTAKPGEKTSAVTVSASSATGRTPLAPLIAEPLPKDVATATLPMTAPAPSNPTPLTAMTNPSSPATSLPTLSPQPGVVPSSGAASSVDDDFGMDFRQLELRAVFGLANVLPAEEVFRLSTSLPGIKAASYVMGDAMVFQHAAGGAKLESVPKAFIHLSALARDLGIKDTRLLTLQTDGGLLAFFNEGAGCLAVLHEGRRFAPGVKERLVIILRELSRGSATTAR